MSLQYREETEAPPGDSLRSPALFTPNADSHMDESEKVSLVESRGGAGSYSKRSPHESSGSQLRHRVTGCTGCNDIVCGICGEPGNIPPRDRYDGSKFISAKYESLDYEKLDNGAIAEENSGKSSWHFWSISFTRWVLTFIIGVITALVACGIDIGIEYLAEMKFGTIKSVASWLEQHPENSALGEFLVFLTWVGISVGLVSVVAFLVVFLAPVAAGSGIPEIKCYLNGIKVPEVVRLKTLFVKASGVLFSVAGGLAVGKEGPMIHGGAAVAAGVSQGRLTPHDRIKLDCTSCVLPVFKKYRNDTEKRDFVACGAAAGVSAAFGAPIGGVLFSLEEGASYVNQALTWRMFFASMTAAFTLNVVLSAFHHHAGDLTYYGIINFGHFPTESEHSYQWFEVPIFIILGVIGGLLGALFNYMNLRLTLFRRRYIRTRLMKFLEPLVVIAITVTVSYMTMFLYDECRPLGTQEEYQDTFGGPIRLFCGEGEYSTIATLFLNTPETSIKNLFHDSNLSYGAPAMSIFFVLYFVLASWTYGLMVSSGLFIPSLLVGASWGRVIGNTINIYVPCVEGYTWSAPGRYALIGASAMLGGVVRMTISITVIVIEATQDTTYGLPIMLSIMVAKWVGDIFGEGLYDIHIELNSVPLLPWEPSPRSGDILATDVMSSPVDTVQTVETVGRIETVLKDTTHNGFPVVEGGTGEDSDHRPTFGTFRGLILRSQLVILLKHKAFYNTAEEATMADVLGSEVFSEAYPRFPHISKINIRSEEKRKLIDLRPYMNHSTYCAFDDFHYPRLFSQFRCVGLRHLVIVNRQNQVIGIVTRKDLARHRMHTHNCESKMEVLNIIRD